MGFRSRFPSPRLIFPMPRINLDPFVHPRRALQSIRRDSAERWRHGVNGNAPCCLHVWPRWCLVILHAEYAMTGTCLWDDWRTIHVVRRIAMQDIARLPGSRMTRIGKSYLSFLSLSLFRSFTPPLRCMRRKAPKGCTARMEKRTEILLPQLRMHRRSACIEARTIPYLRMALVPGTPRASRQITINRR